MALFSNKYNSLIVSAIVVTPCIHREGECAIRWRPRPVAELCHAACRRFPDSLIPQPQPPLRSTATRAAGRIMVRSAGTCHIAKIGALDFRWFD